MSERTPPVWRPQGPVTVDKLSGNQFRILSSPLPVHRAHVIRTMLPVPGWHVLVDTADVKVRSFRRTELHLALKHAAGTVTALMRVDWKKKFTSSQRYIMGRNMCPAKVPCRTVGCPREAETNGIHYHLCMSVPDGGHTIWCTEHTHSMQAHRRPGDAFRSLDESPRGGGSP